MPDVETLRALLSESTRPVLLTGGRVVSLDAMLGDWPQADVLLGGDKIVGVGPGLITAAGDDNAIVVDCTGGVVLPALIDLGSRAGSRENRYDNAGGSLTPGKQADIAVLRSPDGRFPVATSDAVVETLFLAGQVRVWRGRPVVPPPPPPAAEAAEAAGQEHPYAGMWIDETGFLHQELLPDGRYDETRGGRPHAYQGRYWIDGDRVDYLDDLGFWAYGEIRDGVLHHAGYILRRSAA